ncbi:MAG TPA: hypothetical protein PKV15_09765 [Syntrophomonadaceae bacterium]|jgi:DNA repair exonuclease SbcCD ATPase subunit|nr:hypothetical protein [Syntrophomonadaceae bacterium]HRX22037.1 hypothetical protein [Syntrophomonadaceae bacterium]
MAKPFFGGSKEVPPAKTEPVQNPVYNDVQNVQSRNALQSQIDSLQAEIRQAREKLAAAENQVNELQAKVEEYRNKEVQIAEVMINAQISAQRLEAQARVQAEMLQQQTDEELRRKNQELELLRMKVQLFKQDMHERIDHYKASLDRTFETDEEIAFTPTLISKDKKSDKLIG